MTHIYNIHGMTCNGCRGRMEQILNSVNGVSKATVDLEKAEAVIETENHISLEILQKVLADDGGKYSISLPGNKKAEEDHQAKKEVEKSKNTGPRTYYFSMHCEGGKTYDKAGDCPVCGTDLVKEVKTRQLPRNTLARCTQV